MEETIGGGRKAPSFDRRKRSYERSRYRRRREDPEMVPRLPPSNEEISLDQFKAFILRHRYIILITLLALALRICMLKYESFWIDEAMTGLRSRWDFEYLLDEIVSGDQMPFYFFMTWSISKYLGNSVLVLRGLSVIFGLISMIPIYLIARRFGKEAALISILLFAVSPTMLYYSQEARMYMFMVFLSAFSIHFFLNIVDQEREKRTVSLIMLLFINILLVYTHYFGILFVFLELISMVGLLLFHNIRSKRTIGLSTISKRIWPLVLSGLSFLPWFIYQQREQSLSEKTTGGSLGLGLDLIPETFRFLGGQYTAIYRNDTSIAVVVGYIFLFLFIISLIIFLMRRYREQEGLNFLVLSAILLVISPLAAYAVSHWFTPMYNHRYFIFLAAPFFIILGAALSSLRVWLAGYNEALKVPIIAAVTVLVLVSLTVDADQLIRRDKADWKGGIDFVLENQRPSDVVIPFPDHEQMLIYYYTDELDIRLLGAIDDQEEFLRDNPRVWVLFYETEPIDEQPLIRELNDRDVEEYRVEDIIIRLYWT